MFLCSSFISLTLYAHVDMMFAYSINFKHCFLFFTNFIIFKMRIPASFQVKSMLWCRWAKGWLLNAYISCALGFGRCARYVGLDVWSLHRFGELLNWKYLLLYHRFGLDGTFSVVYWLLHMGMGQPSSNGSDVLCQLLIIPRRLLSHCHL